MISDDPAVDRRYGGTTGAAGMTMVYGGMQSLTTLSNQALLAETARLAARERAAPAASVVGDAPRDPGATAATVPSVRPAPPPVVRPLAPESYKVQFTIGRATFDRLRRGQDLLRHAVPTGDPAVIFSAGSRFSSSSWNGAGSLDQRRLDAVGKNRFGRAALRC